MMRFTPEEMSVLSSFTTDLAFANREDLLMKVVEAICEVNRWRADNPAQAKGDDQTAT